MLTRGCANVELLLYNRIHQLILWNIVQALKRFGLKWIHFRTLWPSTLAVIRRELRCLPLLQSLCKEVKEKFAQGIKIEIQQMHFTVYELTMGGSTISYKVANLHVANCSVSQVRRVCSSCYICMYISNI